MNLIPQHSLTVKLLSRLLEALKVTVQPTLEGKYSCNVTSCVLIFPNNFLNGKIPILISI